MKKSSILFLIVSAIVLGTDIFFNVFDIQTKKILFWVYVFSCFMLIRWEKTRVKKV
jgi:hypothetical protein